MALGSSSLHEIVHVILASRGVIGFAVGMAMPAAQIYVRNDTNWISIISSKIIFYSERH